MKLLPVVTISIVAFIGSVTQSAHAELHNWESSKCVYKHNNTIYDELDAYRFGCVASTAPIPDDEPVNPDSFAASTSTSFLMGPAAKHSHASTSLVVIKDHKDCLFTVEVKRK